MAVACSVDSFRWIQEENHAVYKVVCRAADEQWSVERRHSEFALLARNARERVGGGVPALPRTRRGWGFDPDMLERRRATLDAWLKAAPRGRAEEVDRFLAAAAERGRGARAGNKAARAKARAQTGGGRAGAAAAAAAEATAAAAAALWTLLAVTTLALGPEAGVACAAAALLGSRAFAASAAPAAVEPSREDPSDGAAKIADEAGLLNRADRHEEWAKWKVWFAIEYRNKAAAADAGPTRVVDARLARVIEDEAGTDVAGSTSTAATDQRPVVWCRSAKIDMRGLGRAGVKDWVDAVASLFELCCLASNGRPKYGFTYIEHSGDEASRIPAWTGLRVVRGAVEMGLKGFPERGNSFTTLNASRINRVLFALAAPFMSPPLRARMFLLPGGADATERAAEILGGAHGPFAGGPPSPDADGDVDSSSSSTAAQET
ncbi:CRAL/TRIO domain containing protein [Aureococcus anophagefferens]|nr:CRAL/TRIO domain containing protein [Aureococcus anophagefferens]